MNSLDNFCGIENGSFKVWNPEAKNFGSCFVILAVVCPGNAVLLFLSAYYSGKKALNIPIGEVGTPLFVIVRIVISCIIALEPLIEIACTLLIQPWHPPSVLLTDSLIALTWIFNSIALWKIRIRFLTQKCLPKALLTGTLIVLLTSIFHSYSIIYAIIKDASTHSVYNYGTITRLILQIIYLTSLVNCSANDDVFSNSLPHVNTGLIQARDGAENDRLLRSISQGTYYSSIQCVSDDLGAAEDPYNPLSKLCFWWVRHLMLKGFKGKIQSEEDLFMLPKSLRTSHIQEIFLKEFYWKPKEFPEPRTPGSSKTSCSMSDFEDSGSYVDVKFSGDGSEDVFCTSSSIQRRLLSALHHSFGWQYYCLGILKLLGDALGFAGPLLLHALVSFMENKKVILKSCNFHS